MEECTQVKLFETFQTTFLSCPTIQKQIFEEDAALLIHKILPSRVKILWGNEDVSLWPIKKAFVRGNIPNCGKLPEKFPSLGSGQIYYSGWWRERSQGDFTNPTTQVPPPKEIQQSSQVENTRKHFFGQASAFYKKHLVILLPNQTNTIFFDL